MITFRHLKEGGVIYYISLANNYTFLMYQVKILEISHLRGERLVLRLSNDEHIVVREYQLDKTTISKNYHSDICSFIKSYLSIMQRLKNRYSEVNCTYNLTTSRREDQANLLRELSHKMRKMVYDNNILFVRKTLNYYNS